LAEHPNPEETPPGEPLDAGAPQEQPRGGVTPGGYEYTVVSDTADEERPSERPERQAEPRPRRTFSLGLPALIALALIPAIVAGVAVWFLADMLGAGGGDDDERLERNVANVVNAFTQQQGARTVRYEGQVPPSFPDDIPQYPGARVVSSLVQVRGDDAQYIVVYDTEDTRQDVGNYFAEAFAEDPWQVEIEQVGRESTVQQFSNIEDADVSGIVLAVESLEDETTTIFMSVQVVGGASDNEPEDFEPGASKPLPAGFPGDDIPQYPDSILIESAYQKQPNATQYLISLITRDDPGDVIDYYRETLEERGFTVEDGDPEQNPEGGESITFASTDPELSGSVTAFEFADDENYTQVDVQVQTAD